MARKAARTATDHPLSLRAAARLTVPRVVEATVVPSALLFVGFRVGGMTTGLLAALAWGYGLMGYRIARRQRTSALLVLCTVGLTLRTAMALSSGSAFLYLLQPILGLFLVAAVFLGSVAVSRPLVARMARDFCPLTKEIAARLPIRRLFRNLTLMWGLVCLANAGLALWLLLTMQVETYLAVKPVTTGVVTWAAVLATFVWSLSVARSEGLVGHRGRALTA